MSRGGQRQGKPNTAYANRTDLNTPKAVTIAPATGQQYGAAKAQADARSVIPMANAPLGIGSAPSAMPPRSGAIPPGTPMTPEHLFGPTQRPNEHFMTGVDAGPGAGSEALAPNPFVNNAASAILATLNSIPNPSSQVQFTKTYLAMQQENQMPH
jgi:hypothetical protein